MLLILRSGSLYLKIDVEKYDMNEDVASCK